MLYIKDMIKKNRAVRNMMLLGMTRRKLIASQDGKKAKKKFMKKKMKRITSVKGKEPND